MVGFNYSFTAAIKPRSFLSWLVSLHRSVVSELRSNMTVRMAAAADQVFLVSDQDSPTRQLLLSAQKLKTCFFFYIFIKRKQKTGKVVFVTRRLLCLCV